MNKIIFIFLAILGLAGGGYYFYQARQTSSSKTSEAPTNPPGVVNPEVASSNYRLFSKSEYEKALADKKVVMLFFTANWCPICREQEPVNMSTMKALEKESEIVAFRVHILDSETTKETESLADEYDVFYQHTFIILDKEGKQSFRLTGTISGSDLGDRLLEAGGK